jgi:hypothetical protein
MILAPQITNILSYLFSVFLKTSFHKTSTIFFSGNPRPQTEDKQKFICKQNCSGNILYVEVFSL